VGRDGAGSLEAVLVARQIEPHAGRGDHADGEKGEVEAAVAADPGEALLHDGGGVLGHVDEHTAGLGHGIGVETGRAAGHGDGEVESEPALADLGGAADDADPGARPEGLDEPAARLVPLVEIGGAHHGQGGGGLGSHPVTACTAGEASMAASMVWSSTKFCSSRGLRAAPDAADPKPRGYAAAGPEEQLAGGVGEDRLGGPGRLEAVVDHGGEEVAIERLEMDLVDHTHGERGMDLHAQVASSAGRPTSHRVTRSRLSKAKLRNPDRSTRKESDKCCASSRTMRGACRARPPCAPASS